MSEFVEHGNPRAPRNMTRFQRLLCDINLRFIWWRRRWIPHIVWYNDELDVVVTFKEDRLNQNDPLGHFQQGRLPKIQAMLKEIGIGFDTGQGAEGRDWEWDYSLNGPISVRFKGRAKKPERRL